MLKKPNIPLEIVYCENVPEDLEPYTLYVSEEYATAIHLCACGCGNEVVTPQSSDEWIITKDPAGRVSMRPSIGNYSFKCKSHYYITNDEIVWC